MRLIKPFDLPAEHFNAIHVDPPWHFETWSPKGFGRHAIKHYRTMSVSQIMALPVIDLVACGQAVLFLWIPWPMLEHGMKVIEAWGFEYKTCAFCWVKTNSTNNNVWQGTGYWTRANSEVCLLATTGRPKRLNNDVAQVIIEPRRQHSRKPDCVRERIERLVEGPYADLFARSRPPSTSWHTWGDQKNLFDHEATGAEHARQPAEDTHRA